MVGGESSATAASLDSAGRTPCLSTTMPTNSRLAQHRLDFAKFTENLQAREDRCHKVKVAIEIRPVNENVVNIILHSVSL